MAITLTEIIESAREITGNKESNALGELYIPRQAVEPEMISLIQKLNLVIGTDTRKEVLFDTVAGTQDYNIEDTIAGDVRSIESVVRSVQHFDSLQLRDRINRQDYIYGGGVIHPGYQGAAQDVILQLDNARRDDQFSHEVVNVDDARILRLMPCPESVEKVEVIYISNSLSITDLPDDAKTALIHGAVVCILDATLNRIDSQMQQISGSNLQNLHGPASQERRESLQAQRDYYAGKLEEDLVDLRE